MSLISTCQRSLEDPTRCCHDSECISMPTLAALDRDFTEHLYCLDHALTDERIVATKTYVMRVET